MPRKLNGIVKQGKSALERSGQSMRPDKITPLQYEKGWDLISTGHSIPQVVAGTGLTKTQLAWLMREGDPSNGMPSYGQRVLEQATEVRKRAREAADEVGRGGLDAIKRQLGLTRVSQQITNLVIQEIGRELAENMQRSPADRVPMEELVPSKDVTNLLKVLRPYTNVGEVAVAFRQIYDSPFQRNDPLSGLPRDARVDLSNDAVVPASLALMEGVQDEEMVDEKLHADVLAELLPDYESWTDEEVEAFISTGERPMEDYTDTGSIAFENPLDKDS